MEKLDVIVGREYPNGNVPGRSEVNGQIVCLLTIEPVDPTVSYHKLEGGILKPAEYDPRTKQETILKHPPFTDI